MMGTGGTHLKICACRGTDGKMTLRCGKLHSMFAASLLILFLTLPSVALAGGANTKTGVGKGNGKSCSAGFYYDADSGKCVAANWI